MSPLSFLILFESSLFFTWWVWLKVLINFIYLLKNQFLVSVIFSTVVFFFFFVVSSRRNIGFQQTQWKEGWASIKVGLYPDFLASLWGEKALPRWEEGRAEGRWMFQTLGSVVWSPRRRRVQRGAWVNRRCWEQLLRSRVQKRELDVPLGHCPAKRARILTARRWLEMGNLAKMSQCVMTTDIVFGSRLTVFVKLTLSNCVRK